MNLDHLQSIAFVQKLAWTLKDAQHDVRRQQVPRLRSSRPFTDLRSVQTLVVGGQARRRLRRSGPVRVRLGGLHRRDLGGIPQVPRLQLCDHRSLRTPHSYHGETDQQLGRKVAAAIKHGRRTRVVRGGDGRRPRSSTARAPCPWRSYKAALAGISRTPLNLVIAYEPVWAIGFRPGGNARSRRNRCAAKLRETTR